MNKKIEKLLKKKGGNYIFPFFWLHGESEDVLRKYMKVIRNSNIGAVCIESRPHPDFCREGWWRDMDIILDEAEKNDMKVWILDDSHFPTGYANGAMEHYPDELCRQSICCRIYETEENGVIHLGEQEIRHPKEFQHTLIEKYTMEKTPRYFEDDRLLGIWGVRMDGEHNGLNKDEDHDRIHLTSYIRDNELVWRVPEGQWKIYVLHLSRNQGYHRSYINMMNQASCRILLDAVYEPHYAHYKKYFGTTISGFFSDEPELGNGHMYEMDHSFGSENDYPWSDELEEEMKKRFGEEYAFKLILLWETVADTDITAKVRYAYMDAVTKLVKKDFSKQIGEWCREHGVEYIGHIIEDDNYHTRTGSSLGHYFRGLQGQDMAGIDDIGGQVFPQGEEISYNRGVFEHRNGEFYHYMLGKLGSSAAAIEPKKRGNSMCELFGNYGWEEGVRLEKYLADHFLVRGINHFVPHAFSAKGFPDPDCPPHFYAHGNNPQYRHFGYLMAYMNRVCELISDGRHISPVAVIYHAEGDWTGKHITSDRIGHILADNQIEYDFIPQDVFSEREIYGTYIQGKSQTESKGILRVNTQMYNMVIIPYMQFVTKALADAIDEMANRGIQVLFVGGYPEGICDSLEDEKLSDAEYILKIRSNAENISLNELMSVLYENKVAEIILKPSNNRIRYYHYVHEDGSSIWMFVNEGTETYKGEIYFMNSDVSKQGICYCYDAWNNCLKKAEIENQKLGLKIEPLKSKIFVIDKGASEQEIHKLLMEQPWESTKREERKFIGTWERSICRSIAYPDFQEKKRVTLPDNLAEEKLGFSGFVRYENTLYAEKDEELYLEISDAHEGVEVFVNGKSLGIQIVPIFYFNLTGVIKTGENKIRIEVATTLERELALHPESRRKKKEARAFSGITGNVKVWKNQSEILD